MNAKPARGRRSAGPVEPNELMPGHVTVRMYNVGFGDAFLVLFPSGQRITKILIDCGSIAKGAEPLDVMVRQIIDDVTEADGVARIDVVVATHRHRDHILGFANPAWRTVEVREVWMPWTEHPTDREAQRIRDAQTRLAAGLEGVAQRQENGTIPLGEPERARLGAWRDLVLNAASNQQAMDTLHDGFAGQALRRFLPEEPPNDAIIRTNALSGVTVHVLGPSRDESVIRDMDPPVGKSYLGSLPDPSDDTWSDVVPGPFSTDWMVVGDMSFAPHLALNETDREKIERIDSDTESLVAVALDKAVNGTSLLLMLKIGRAHLLFTGDSQWGTWQAALHNPIWRALLQRTTFLKIGHHGSHNATPIEFVEETIGRDFCAMASVAPMQRWPLIPKSELLSALGKRTTKIARSDREGEAPADVFTVKQGRYIETQVAT
jgi:beta-lactamase superfamily II metal-dependent hydrolase